jgi:hypothetical protein
LDLKQIAVRIGNLLSSKRDRCLLRYTQNLARDVCTCVYWNIIGDGALRYSFVHCWEISIVYDPVYSRYTSQWCYVLKYTVTLRHALAFMHPNNIDPYFILSGRQCNTDPCPYIRYFMLTVEERLFGYGSRLKKNCVVAISYFIFCFLDCA